MREPERGQIMRRVRIVKTVKRRQDRDLNLDLRSPSGRRLPY
jgi:hypothetical protein